MLFLFIFSYKKYLSRNLPLSKITIILCQKNSQTLVDYGDDKNNEIEARFLKIREMPWILSTLPPITTLSSFNNFLQRVRGRWFWKDQNFKPEDIPLPLLEAKSSLPADFQQRFDDNLSSESRHRKNLFIQSSPGNECKRKCYPTTDLWIHRYTKRYSRKAISPLPLSSPFSSIQHLKTNG